MEFKAFKGNSIQNGGVLLTVRQNFVFVGNDFERLPILKIDGDSLFTVPDGKPLISLSHDLTKIRLWDRPYDAALATIHLNKVYQGDSHYNSVLATFYGSPQIGMAAAAMLLLD